VTGWRQALEGRSTGAGPPEGPPSEPASRTPDGFGPGGDRAAKLAQLTAADARGRLRTKFAGGKGGLRWTRWFRRSVPADAVAFAVGAD